MKTTLKSTINPDSSETYFHLNCSEKQQAQTTGRIDRQNSLCFTSLRFNF